MKRIQMTKEQFNAMDPKKVCVPIWIGSDDIIVNRGDEMIQTAHEIDNLSDALKDRLEDVSGNSFEIVGIVNDELVIIGVDYDKD